MVMPTGSNDEEVQVICQSTTSTIQEYFLNLSNIRYSTCRPSLFTCQTDTLLEISPLGAACALPKVDTLCLVTGSLPRPDNSLQRCARMARDLTVRLRSKRAPDSCGTVLRCRASLGNGHAYGSICRFRLILKSMLYFKLYLN